MTEFDIDRVLGRALVRPTVTWKDRMFAVLNHRPGLWGFAFAVGVVLAAMALIWIIVAVAVSLLTGGSL